MPEPAPTPTPGLAAVRSWCDWTIAPSETVTVKIEGDGGRVLLLPSLRVTDVSEVLDESGAEVTGWKWRENGILRGCWRREELYAVTMTHGYDEMPAELQAIIDKIDAEGVGAGALSSVTKGPFSESYDLSAQPLTVQAIVGRYKIPPRP